jgi:hypothetical protein
LDPKIKSKIRKEKDSQRKSYNERLFLNLKGVISKDPMTLQRIRNTDPEQYKSLEKMYINPSTTKEIQDFFRKYAYFYIPTQGDVSGPAGKRGEEGCHFSCSTRVVGQHPQPAMIPTQPPVHSQPQYPQPIHRVDPFIMVSPHMNSQSGQPDLQTSSRGQSPIPNQSDYILLNTLKRAVSRDPLLIAKIKRDGGPRWKELYAMFIQSKATKEVQNIFWEYANKEIPGEQVTVQQEEAGTYGWHVY